MSPRVKLRLFDFFAVSKYVLNTNDIGFRACRCCFSLDDLDEPNADSLCSLGYLYSSWSCFRAHRLRELAPAAHEAAR